MKKKTLTVISVCYNIALLKPQNKKNCMAYMMKTQFSMFLISYPLSKPKLKIPSCRPIECRNHQRRRWSNRRPLSTPQCTSKCYWFGRLKRKKNRTMHYKVITHRNSIQLQTKFWQYFFLLVYCKCFVVLLFC